MGSEERHSGLGEARGEAGEAVFGQAAEDVLGRHVLSQSLRQLYNGTRVS